MAVANVADRDVADLSRTDPGSGGAFHPCSSGLSKGGAFHADAAALLRQVDWREHWGCAPWTDHHGDPSLGPRSPHQLGGSLQ